MTLIAPFSPLPKLGIQGLQEGSCSGSCAVPCPEEREAPCLTLTRAWGGYREPSGPGPDERRASGGGGEERQLRPRSGSGRGQPWGGRRETPGPRPGPGARPGQAPPEGHGRSAGKGGSRAQTKAGRGRRRGGAVTGRRRLRSRGKSSGKRPGVGTGFRRSPGPGWAGWASRAERRAGGGGARRLLRPPRQERRRVGLGRRPSPLTCSSVKRISLSAALDAISPGFEVRTWALLPLPPPPAGRGAREAGPGPGLRAHRGRGERSALRQAGRGARGGRR